MNDVRFILIFFRLYEAKVDMVQEYKHSLPPTLCPVLFVAASIFSSSNMRLNIWYIIGELLILVECVQVWSKLFYNRELS